MIEKSSLAGKGGGPRPGFHSVYHHVQSCSVRSSWEGRRTPSISVCPNPRCVRYVPTGTNFDGSVQQTNSLICYLCRRRSDIRLPGATPGLLHVLGARAWERLRVVPRSLSKDSPAGQSPGESGGGPASVEAQVSKFDEWRRLMVQSDVFPFLLVKSVPYEKLEDWSQACLCAQFLFSIDPTACFFKDASISCVSNCWYRICGTVIGHIFWPVLRIWVRFRIRRILMFLGLLDPDPDPQVRGMDLDSDPSITKQKKWEKPWSQLLCDFFLTFYLWKMMKMYLQKVISRKTL